MATTIATAAAKRMRSALRKVGLNVHPWPSKRHLVVDYPVERTPRYGTKIGPHPQIKAVLDAKSGEFQRILRELADRKEMLRGIPANEAELNAPFWNNGWFPPLDASALMHFMLKHKPKRYIEIGSGNSTVFANHAKSYGNLATTITSIDPMPRRGIDELCTRVIRKGLQELDLSIFDELESGDILFFDGSHLVFNDSDVTVFFLEVLPRIPPGVLVHIHDIFWPVDYPKAWDTRHYNEQYMLAMLLLYSPAKYDTVFASAHISNEFPAEVEALTTGSSIWDVYGTSYWLETR